MSHEAFRYVEESVPLTRFRDLERIALTCDTATDAGETVPAGTEGTIVDVIKEGTAYAVEFAEPFDGLATLLPHEIRSLESAGT